jgi:hypothetical protein
VIYFPRVKAATARIASLVMLVAAGAVVFALLGLTWYEHTRGTKRSAWEAVPEVGVDLALVGAAATVAFLGVALGVRLPRVLALLGVVAALALTAMLAYRLGEQPPLPNAPDSYSREAGPLTALVAAAVLLAVSLVVAVFTSATTCPDCAERIPRRADRCPHCGHLSTPPRGWKRCSNCRGSVRQQARICKHCRHDLTSQTL